MKLVYLIDYKVLDINNQLIKDGSIRVKNKTNELEAKCSLEGYLKKKYPSMHKLVIDKCSEDFEDAMDMFRSMFESDNPFK